MEPHGQNPWSLSLRPWGGIPSEPTVCGHGASRGIVPFRGAHEMHPPLQDDPHGLRVLSLAEEDGAFLIPLKQARCHHSLESPLGEVLEERNRLKNLGVDHAPRLTDGADGVYDAGQRGVAEARCWSCAGLVMVVEPREDLIMPRFFI